MTTIKELKTVQTNDIELYDIECNFVDICYPDYLSNHYNKDNQELIAIPVYYGMSKEDIMTELYDSMQNYDSKVWNLGLSEDKIKLAIYNEFSCLDKQQIANCVCDYDLDNEDHQVYLYAYLQWDVKPEYTYLIPSLLLPAIINDDSSGLNDYESMLLDVLLSQISYKFKDYNYHFSYSEDENNFTRHHDVSSIGASDCCELYVIVTSRK